jgi:hypothetical protein
MKIFRIAFLTLATVFVAFPTAKADQLHFTFTDGGSLSGAVTLFGTGGHSAFTISSGTISFTYGGPSQTMDLYPTFPGGATYSPAGAFIYDNLISPALNPILDVYGLLFRDAAGDEVNLWGNTGAPYSFYEWVPSVGYTIADNNVSISNITPEPGSLLLLGSGLLGMAVLVSRRAKHSIGTTLA